jgi:hypothetical protein
LLGSRVIDFTVSNLSFWCSVSWAVHMYVVAEWRSSSVFET